MIPILAGGVLADEREVEGERLDGRERNKKQKPETVR